MTTDVSTRIAPCGAGRGKLTLRQLECFIHVAERGSINRAAAELQVAQSAVTRQIQALETCLGATLLERSAKGVQLTAQGRRILECGQGILRMVVEIRWALAGSSACR